VTHSSIAAGNGVFHDTLRGPPPGHFWSARDCAARGRYPREGGAYHAARDPRIFRTRRLQILPTRSLLIYGTLISRHSLAWRWIDPICGRARVDAAAFCYLAWPLHGGAFSATDLPIRKRFVSPSPYLIGSVSVIFISAIPLLQVLDKDGRMADDFTLSFGPQEAPKRGIPLGRQGFRLRSSPISRWVCKFVVLGVC